MPNFRIFTESKADVRFIRDYIWEIFGAELSEDDDFDTLGGHSGYKDGNGVKKSIQQNHDDGNRTILILDADNDFEQRKTEVLGYFEKYALSVELFLFPNNADNGQLEDLLSEIATVRPLIDCFLAYENCTKEYHHPALHEARIYAYLDTLLPENEKVSKKNDLRIGPNRNYRIPAHWDLHHAYLQPLHDFLAPFFKQ